MVHDSVSGNVHESVCWNVSGMFLRTYVSGNVHDSVCWSVSGNAHKTNILITTFTLTFCSEDIIQVWILAVLAFHIKVQWIAVHLQQRIAKLQNHNQIVRYEYHYQFILAKLALSLGKLIELLSFHRISLNLCLFLWVSRHGKIHHRGC